MNANAPHQATDNTIGRALSALRDAAPRPGLEGRILAGIEHRTIAPQPTRLHFSAHLALWTAACAAILAVTSLTILHHRVAPAKSTIILNEASQRHSDTNAVILSEAARSDAQSKDPEDAHLTTNPKPFPTTNLAQETTHHLPPTLSSRPERVARSGETCISSHPECSAHAEDALSQTPTDAQALADLHAPSHPAPPLPLTPQERLFLHILRYGDATELAELNPKVRAQRDADETAAFKAFFPDPPPLKQPGDPE